MCLRLVLLLLDCALAMCSVFRHLGVAGLFCVALWRGGGCSFSELLSGGRSSSLCLLFSFRVVGGADVYLMWWMMVWC